MFDEFEEDPDDYDDDYEGFYDDDEELEDEASSEFESIVGHLRETLTFDMALKSYRTRMGSDPESDEDLEAYMEELVTEAYNAEMDEWDDTFLYG